MFHMSKSTTLANPGVTSDRQPHDLIEEHFLDALKFWRNPPLLSQKKNGVWTISGELHFEATHNKITLEDHYSIEILIPSDYPNTPPTAKEVGRRIPKYFHKMSDETLCLAAPLEIKIKFTQSQSLVGFIEMLLIPYLFSFSYFTQYGEMPYGELAHGGPGILDYYSQLFDVSSDINSLSLIKILVEDNYRGHQACPCGSGKRLRYCHGPLLIILKGYQNQSDFLHDYFQILKTLHKSGKPIPKFLLSKKLQRIIEKHDEDIEKKYKNGVMPRKG